MKTESWMLSVVCGSIEVASVIQDKGNCEQKKYSFAVEITNFRNEGKDV